MNQQEQELIASLAERLRTAPPPQIDRDADDLIRRTIGSHPDALYILAQTVLVQEMALNQARDRIRQLEQGAAQPGFLPGQPQGGYAQSAYAQPGYAQPGYAQPAYMDAPPPRSGFSGFLHNAATTAAGVLAGEIAFDSLSALFSGGRGGGFFGGGGIMPGGETIVNNYYEDRPDRGFPEHNLNDAAGDSRFGQFADNSDQGISPDIEDDRGDSGSDSFFDDNGGGGSDDSL